MKHTRLLLALVLGLACVNLKAQYSEMTPLITEEWQLSSPFTDAVEGTDIGALIDGSRYTYWHSDWHSTPRADYHWVDVALHNSEKGIFCLYMHRRDSGNDHPIEVVVSGSNDGVEWRDIATLDLPYQGFSGVTSAPFKVTEAVDYVRITPIDCYQVFSTIWHAAELQLYLVSENYDYGTDMSGVRINEIQVANIDQHIDHSFNYGGWIELYNTSSTTYALEGVKVRHTDMDGVVEEFDLGLGHGLLKGNEYTSLWFDHNSEDGVFGENAHLQIPFKMDPEGGIIEVLNVDGDVVDAVMYPAAISRCSYARIADGAEEWGWTAYATPGGSNDGSLFASQRLSAPVVSEESTLFTTEVSFSVEIPDGTTLRYTTDGSTPTVTHGMTSRDGKFEAQSTTVFRFVLVADDKLPSQVVTRTFIKDENDLQIPVLCVSTAPENLYDDMIGVYTKGTNGVSGKGQGSACNWNMDWERPVNIEYLIKEDGEYRPVLNQEGEFKIAGGWSRAYGGGNGWPMKSSFRLKAGKVYEGNNSFDYPFFAGKPYNKYKTLQVRNGGNDTYARIYDAAIHEIFRRSGFYVDCQAWQPCHVFFNGEYLGMLNLRENNNKHYGESGYGIDTDEMDQFELNSEIGYEQKEGTMEAFLKWLELTKVLAADPTNEEVWQEICAMVDIDEYCNYMAAECYLGCSDWLTNSNNLKGFRSRNDDGKFHLVLFDADSAFGTTDMISSIYSLLSRYDGRYSDNYGVSYLAEIFFNMLRYEPFRQQFIHAFSIVGGSVMEPERCKEIIDEMVAYTSPALALEGNDPTGSASNLYSYISSSGRRHSRMENMKAFLGLTEEYKVSLSSNIPEARLLVDGQEIPTRKFNGTLYGPVSITTKAPAGYTFRGWSMVSNAESQVDVVPFGSTWTYYDQGSLDGTWWKYLSYDTYMWSTGLAPFGYGTVGIVADAADYNTVLDYGGDASNKRPTYYFRQEFSLEETPSAGENFTLHYYLDDGAIFYVNGIEVGTYQCVSGSTYYDYSTAYEGSEAAYGMIDVSSSLLQEGTNIITVEVHNTSASSSDIFFDARLTRSVSESSGSFIGSEEVLVFNEELISGSCEIVAMYDKLEDPSKVLESGASPIRINEVSAGNSIYINDHYKKNDWVELYNTTGEDIDVGGMYLSDSRSNPQKYQINADGSMASTIVPAYGRLLVWCDKLAPISQLHAPFKLDNADGACVILQAADGTWSDELEYLAQDRWQTYGRYPDGGTHSAYLEHPSIALPNVLSVYDFAFDNADWGDSQMAITLALEKGWNWTSHNLNSSVHASRFTGYAQHIVGQYESYVKDGDDEWSGALDAINTATGYKIKMSAAADVTLRGTLFDVKTPVDVEQGWNWLGCPLYNATTIEAALKGYTPSEGDAIVGINAFATYEDGRWLGTLTSLLPGQAYLLKCNKEQTFCWNSLSASAVLRRAKRYEAPEKEVAVAIPWQVDMHAYPNATSVIAEYISESAAGFVVAAFCGDECRGIAQEVEGLLYMNIYGAGGETLRFKLVDEGGEIYDLEQTITLNPESVVGSRKAPLQLTLKGSDVHSISSSMRVVSTVYYTLNGVQMSKPANGAFIEKVVYENGDAVIRKIVR